MANTVYFGNFSCWEDVVREFSGYDLAEQNLQKYPEPDEVYYAGYETPSYEGYALVLWKNKRKYYILSGSHCSCYGLEETGMDPEEFKTKKLFIAFLEKTNYEYHGLSDSIKQGILKKLKK